MGAAMNERTEQRDSGTEAYHPTVWRTCRTLANPNRLRCLKAVLEEPSRTVCEIAERTRLSVCHTSGYLRALQARGLLQARRESRYVRYVAVPDPLVAGARPLLAALRQVLQKDDQTESAIIHTLTGFTHPRRLAILRLLQERSPVCTEDIAAITRISLPALSRHLNKLRVRGLAAYDGEKWAPALIRDPLAKTLLTLLAASGS
jgi:DNA-binding transcriptional ArsR family regulator